MRARTLQLSKKFRSCDVDCIQPLCSRSKSGCLSRLINNHLLTRGDQAQKVGMSLGLHFD